MLPKSSSAQEPLIQFNIPILSYAIAEWRIVICSLDFGKDASTRSMIMMRIAKRIALLVAWTLSSPIILELAVAYICTEIDRVDSLPKARICRATTIPPLLPLQGMLHPLLALKRLNHQPSRYPQPPSPKQTRRRRRRHSHLSLLKMRTKW